MNTPTVAFAGAALYCSVVIWAVDPGCAQETRRQAQEQNSQQSQYRDQAQNSSEGQAQQNVRSFRGKVSQKENSFFLEELLHRRCNHVVYQGTAPNTRMDLPGVGYVVLNEQTVTGDGISSSSMTVNMIHVYLRDALTGVTTGEIVVGSAQSAVGL